MNAVGHRYVEERYGSSFLKNHGFLMVVMPVVLAISTAAAAGSNVFDFGKAPLSAYSTPRQVRCSFTLENTRGSLLPSADVWVRVPVKITATQWCRKIEASEPAELKSDEAGNQVLHFKVADIPPYGSRIIRITTELDLSAVPQSLHSDPGSVESYRRAGRNVESDAGEIFSLAGTLRGKTPSETPANLCRWIAENLKYTGYHNNDRGALWAFKNKQGDCSEFASLFAALCRADGIPSRRLGGFVCADNSILKPYDHHNWAEFYDGKVWRVADPQKRVFDQNQSRYIAWMFVEGDSKDDPLEGRRLFSFAGEGLDVRMNK